MAIDMQSFRPVSGSPEFMKAWAGQVEARLSSPETLPPMGAVLDYLRGKLRESRTDSARAQAIVSARARNAGRPIVARKPAPRTRTRAATRTPEMPPALTAEAARQIADVFQGLRHEREVSSHYGSADARAATRINDARLAAEARELAARRRVGY